MRSEKKYDLFLSYSREDVDQVRRLADELDERKVRVWFDKDILKPGDRWQKEMAAGLCEARCCVVCVGVSSPAGWFEAEVDEALNMEREGKLEKVFAVLLPGSNEEKIPPFLRASQWVDLRVDSNRAEGLLQLVSRFRPPASGNEAPTRVSQLDRYVKQTLAQIKYLSEIEPSVGKELVEELTREIVVENLRRIESMRGLPH